MAEAERLIDAIRVPRVLTSMECSRLSRCHRGAHRCARTRCI